MLLREVFGIIFNNSGKCPSIVKKIRTKQKNMSSKFIKNCGIEGENILRFLFSNSSVIWVLNLQSTEGFIFYP